MSEEEEEEEWSDRMAKNPLAGGGNWGRADEGTGK